MKIIVFLLLMQQILFKSRESMLFANSHDNKENSIPFLRLLPPPFVAEHENLHLSNLS
jgi:hypothetical protein